MNDWQIHLSAPERQRLRAIGYWQSAAQPELPHPATHADAEWQPEERQATIQYLRSGAVCERWLGFSTCRLCGQTGRALGDADLTDGTWIWPEGLPHYLEQHAVRPPDEFLEHLQQYRFRLPGPIVPAEITVARLNPALLDGMARTEDADTVRFHLARSPGRRDLYLAVTVSKTTGCFRVEYNEELLAAERQRVARSMNPPQWRRMVRLLFGL